MGIWDVICEHIRHNQDATVADVLGQKNGSMRNRCGHYSPIPRGILDHIMQKHPQDNTVEGWMCKLQAAVRDGEGEGDDPSLQMQVVEIIRKAQEPRKGGKWTKDEFEESGRRWHREIMVQWNQGVQEKQISRAEAKFIRKEGSFPIFIKEQTLPMWDAWKGASFEAIQGLYEMSLQMQRTKMKSLRSVDKELYGSRKKLEGKQLEERMKASKEARRTHQIMKWTALINDVLIWRSTELTAMEVEKEINEGREPIIRSHEAVRERKKRRLAKYMKALSLLIAPYDPDDDETLGNEDSLLEESVVRPAGVPTVSIEEQLQKIVGGFLKHAKKGHP
jgi:hypothetical protein